MLLDVRFSSLRYSSCRDEPLQYISVSLEWNKREGGREEEKREGGREGGKKRERDHDTRNSAPGRFE